MVRSLMQSLLDLDLESYEALSCVTALTLLTPQGHSEVQRGEGGSAKASSPETPKWRPQIHDREGKWVMSPCIKHIFYGQNP